MEPGSDIPLGYVWGVVLGGFFLVAAALAFSYRRHRREQARRLGVHDPKADQRERG